MVLDHPIVMGILNVTPDSFSDGGNFFSPESALVHANMMVADGVDIIDVGGESTRPGAVPIEAAQESERVVPVIQEIRRLYPDLVISIDTVKASVASAALDAGADIVNDVSALRLDPEMPGLVARRGCGVVLIHSRGDVSDMATYDNAIYDDVVSEVLAELGSQMLMAEDAGIDRKQIVLDPGFGFSKKAHHSWELFHGLPRFTSYDVPVMIGVGAAFDFHAGLKQQAPRWIQHSGLEWLFRLGTEPRRLWKRYLRNNPEFVYLAMQGVWRAYRAGRERTEAAGTAARNGHSLHQDPIRG